MKKVVLQVKYCYSEQELNEFLATLQLPLKSIDIDVEKPTLYGIQYMANMRGNGVETAEPDENGVKAKVIVDNGVIAMVQYYTVIEVI